MKEKKVLMIVDDDKDDRFFFRDAVARISRTYECMEAENGLDALQKLQKASRLPDFIFLDLNMQVMNGRECLFELKKDPELQHIPIIIYSTSDYEKDRVDTKKMGAVYYLTKKPDIVNLPGEIVMAMAAAVNILTF
jgi:CheY-like chemotaxis protein